jgi:hypothetical protein
MNSVHQTFFKTSLKDLKAHIDSKTVVVGDFNNPYNELIGHSNKKSINKF